MSDNEKQAYYGKEWTKSMIPDVSIVILCYKTGERIRTFVDKVIRHDGMLRKFISEVYNLLFKILFRGIKMRDVNSKPKIIKKSAYDKMHLVHC